MVVPGSDPQEARPEEYLAVPPPLGTSRRWEVVDAGTDPLVEAGRPASHLPGRRGRARIVEAPGHNLPLPLNTFVGRVEELSRLVELLARARLVTVVGPPGVGKSRLALELSSQFASGRAPGHAPGARLVELAPLSDPASVPQAMATALSLRGEPGRPLVDTLIAHLRSRRLLLVVDNCEHLVAACGDLVDVLLRVCPGLRILATSREPLGVAGETVFVLPPLSLPGPDDAPGAPCDAVELFVERAAPGGFVLTADNATAVAEICRRLDGIPLAIEFAAARVGVLSPRQIADRLSYRFPLLRGVARGGPPRHQTLMAALEWSHELLPEPERILLRRLAVFAGGWTLEAAEDVCGWGELEGDQILEVLGRLVAKSLVVAETSGSEARYRLLETIRGYGRHKLVEAGEESGVASRHADWYARLAEEAEPELAGARQAFWLARLEAEYPNILAALQWSLGNGRAKPERECGVRLAAALTLFWLVRGHLVEGREWLAMAEAGVRASPSRRAKVLWGAGHLAFALGEFAAVVPAGEESLALSRQSGEIRGIARALHLLGTARVVTDPQGARTLLEESAGLSRRTGDAWCLAGSLGMLGFAAIFQGEFLTARRPLERCVAVAREAGDEQGLRTGLLGLGFAALQQGDYEEARRLLEEGLVVARELGDTLWTAVALVYRGELAAVRGEHRRARALDEEALVLARETRSPFFLGLCLSYLGMVILASGEDVEAARPLFEEALAFPREAELPANVAIALMGLGEVALVLDGPGVARPPLDEALGLARACGDKLLIARGLHSRGRLARAEGDAEEARSLHHQALALEAEIGHTAGVVRSLEALAGLAAGDGRHEYAARLFGCAQSTREAIGYSRSPVEEARHDADLSLVREALSAEEFTAAWEQGTHRAVSIEEFTAAWAQGTHPSLLGIVAYVRRGRGRRRRSPTGWASLTRTEREVAGLVVEGMTNAEIGARLFISPRTVQSHLSHIFAKLGINSRRELAREPLRPPG